LKNKDITKKTGNDSKWDYGVLCGLAVLECFA
jgi:hypothetical protein